MIETGEIKQFQDIFDYAQITPLIRYLKTNHETLQNYITNVTQARIITILRIGEYFEMDEKMMMDLVVNQIVAGKRKRKPT